jgi:hypothetical protein
MIVNASPSKTCVAARILSVKYWMISASESGPGSFRASRKRNRSGMLENNSSIEPAPIAESIS